MKRKRILRLILGDQLNANHSWYRSKCEDTLYLIAELRQETNYTCHHIQKICAFFLAMEKFAEALRESGHDVLYLTLDETVKFPDLPALLSDVIDEHQIETFEYQQPDEYRIVKQLQDCNLPCKKSCVESEHFFLAHSEIEDYFKPGQHQRMEFFYRKMRKRFSILVDDKQQPLGGKWNFDAENRNKLKASDIAQLPTPFIFTNDVKKILRRLEHHGVKTMGKITDSSLPWPVTRAQAREMVDEFCTSRLPYFGFFQDAMTDQSPHAWALYHSRISFALNAKLILPAWVISRAIAAYDTQTGVAPISLAQLEGFIRQILGWREFVRGLYWANMPHYIDINYFNVHQPLPRFFWDAETQMQCLKSAIGQALEFSYSHHIQRLMVIGNYCLLTERDPSEVDEWYLGIYIDALDWVEKPNTRGMALFADGGLLASKPYCASGNYINKMSDYCKSCHYKVKETVGELACPFNSLYWRFMDKHRETLESNHRLAVLYRNWDRRSETEKLAILKQAQSHLNSR